MLKSGKVMLRSALLAALIITFLFATASATEFEPLKPGDSCPEVFTLKTNLKAKGYYTVKNDSTDIYTDSLRNAVGVFQTANNIKTEPEEYGFADGQTQSLAGSDKAIFYNEYKQLQPGGRGAYVKKAQRQLNKLGYYAGKIDSRYRSSTEAAMKYFQTANGLPATGKGDKQTRDILYSTDKNALPVTRAQYEDIINITPLSLGAKGAQVDQLQEQLVKMGFLGGPFWGDPSGVYDAQTKYSVRFFQEANGLSVTGSATRTLRAKINGSDAVSYDQFIKEHKGIELMQLSSSAKPGIKGAVLQLRLKELGYYKGLITGAYTSPVITAVRTFQIFNNMPSKYVTGKANLETRKKMLDAAAMAYGEVCGDNTLRQGDTGVEVEKLQARLKELGYYNGEINGIYGSVVTSAVKVFQRFNGFYPSGIAYTNVRKKLDDPTAISYTNAKVEKLIDIAKSYLGVPYSSPANPPKSFDCSTFTAYCMNKMGVRLTSSVVYQGNSKIGRRIKITNNNSYKELKPGDLLYFYTPNNDGKPNKRKVPGHAGIYLGRNSQGKYQFIHASSGRSGKKVLVSDLKEYNERDYGPWFLWAIRVWE